MLTANSSASESQREIPSSVIAHRLDLAVVERERAMNNAAESMVDAARVANAEADRAQKQCDEARSKARQKRVEIDTLTSRLNSLQKEVKELEARTASYKKEITQRSMDDDEEAKRAKLIAPVLRNAERRLAASASSSPTGRNSGADATSGMTYAEYIFLVHRLSAEVDAEENGVASLRRQHQDVFSKLKTASSEVDQLKETLKRLEERRRNLQEQQLLLAASNANPAHREALNVQDKYKQLAAALEGKEEEVRQIRMESQTLTLHLMAGAEQRSAALQALRKSIVAKAAGGTSSVADSGSNFVMELLKENAKRRSDLQAIMLSNDKEKDALRQYIAVLSQRLDDATHRHYLASRKQVSS